MNYKPFSLWPWKSSIDTKFNRVGYQKIFSSSHSSNGSPVAADQQSGNYSLLLLSLVISLFKKISATITMAEIHNIHQSIVIVCRRCSQIAIRNGFQGIPIGFKWIANKLNIPLWFVGSLVVSLPYSMGNCFRIRYSIFFTLERLLFGLIDFQCSHYLL